MKARKAALALLFALSAFISVPAVYAGQISSVRTVSESRYTTAHSLDDNYIFDTRDGWQTVNITNLQYKYRSNSDKVDLDPSGIRPLRERAEKSSLGKAIAGVVGNIMKGLKGMGDAESVTITWYTGHDLKNPSCWAKGKWAPTDASFACALTMEGWTTRPKCFKFLELCSTHKKCVFVRVVDTCAGCAPGSKHIDLTRAAFGQLAPFDVGVLTAKFRPATEPDAWYEKLWGPKVHEK